MKKLAVYPVLVFVIGFLLSNLSFDYSFSDFKDYSTLLFGISSMVFTIMGIWIAFMYPNAMAKIVDSIDIKTEKDQILKDTQRVESLILAIVKSALVVTALMILFLANLVFSKTNFFFFYCSEIKLLYLTIIVFLTYIQLESIFYVVKSNIVFIINLHDEKEKKEHKADI